MARFGHRAPSGARGQHSARRRGAGKRSKKSFVERLSRDFGFVAVALLLGFGLGYAWIPSSDRPSLPQAESHLVAYAPARHFPICGSAKRVNCVVDGDTFWYKGERVRISDIDAPEVRGAECAHEAQLADRSTKRLQELLNAGPFELRRNGSRDRDVYGRLLRTVHRDNRSLGDRLVEEGLARPWRGRSEYWCG